MYTFEKSDVVKGKLIKNTYSEVLYFIPNNNKLHAVEFRENKEPIGYPINQLPNEILELSKRNK
ncbi:MAG: hypothetical protein KGY67_00305 [Candidatus Thermoplasmatota archaeon]|nr:hypothetical protein [Candidatus Thermoplasmatota archaeon]